MTESDIYRDIAQRTQGDIYIGVVGPVRTGKSTFIKRFMETVVLPNMDESFKRERAVDEMPQSATGRMIMTTEPKFIPEDAVRVELGNSAEMNVRMIDCVGYIVPAAVGYIEEGRPRMVKTPWFDEDIPFNMAAEIGTKKVIEEHSTIGLVVTTDGSIGEIAREDYVDAERRVIDELQNIGKPFIVLLNCREPQSAAAQALAKDMTEEYSVPVMAVNCMKMSEDEIKSILSGVLFEFPLKEVALDMPTWVSGLNGSHWLRCAVESSIRSCAENMKKVRDVSSFAKKLCDCEYISDTKTSGMNLADGGASVKIVMDSSLFLKILGEATDMELADEEALMNSMLELAKAKKAYDRLQNAMNEVEATGYGIVLPTIDELSLEEPEIMKQGGKYGVRLRASAPSIHMMRASITTEVAPIVGSETQSEELVTYLLREFEENPSKIWESNIFGKSLHELVNEGLHNKLYRMPADARMKLQETLEKIINEGCSGLICIIL